MSDLVRMALTEAFSLYLVAPPDECFQKKDDLVKSVHLRQAPKRIRYDKDHAQILSLPNLNRVSGQQTRVSRINTTGRCAQGMWAGKLIAAAENQSTIKKRWLQYAYDPYLDINMDAKYLAQKRLFPLLYGLWCFFPRRKTPNPYLMPRALILFECVIADAVMYCRTGLNNQKTSNTYKSELMGYGNGKAAYQRADYSRLWAPVERDLRAMLTLLDRIAMEPVFTAYDALMPGRLNDNLLKVSIT